MKGTNVIDGGHLIYTIRWLSNKTDIEMVKNYCDYVTLTKDKQYVSMVFDGYS